MGRRSRPLTGGVDQQTINTVRGAGGDVIPSFGGWSGNKLESSCSSAGELAAAYQKVINAYGLKAIDIDIEAEAYNSPTVQQRTVDALKTIKAANPGIKVYVTFGTGQNGPDTGLINRAAAGLTVDSWTIMPFDFGGAGQNMGTLTIRAAEGLKTAVKNAYGYSDDQTYRSMGISSMNGITDVNETVTVADFRTILAYAQTHHLARLTFWSVNRDRPCTGGGADTCSGVGQQAWDYTRVFAQYAYFDGRGDAMRTQSYEDRELRRRMVRIPVTVNGTVPDHAPADRDRPGDVAGRPAPTAAWRRGPGPRPHCPPGGSPSPTRAAASASTHAPPRAATAPRCSSTPATPPSPRTGASRTPVAAMSERATATPTARSGT